MSGARPKADVVHRGGPLTAAAAVLCLLAGLVAPPAFAVDEDLAVVATIDGRELRGADANRPVRLSAAKAARVKVSVTNRGDSEVLVRSVRIDGRVMGLTFFSYETRVDMRVPAGGSDERTYDLDLLDLASQATGLLPARLALLDDQRQLLAAQRFSTDVDGSLRSLYGTFGLIVAAMTLALLAGVAFRLVTHRLPVNRWKRGVMFGTCGLGIGLTLTFSLSAVRVLSPDPSRWLTLVVVSGVILFVLGYITPTPVDPDDAGDGPPDGSGWPTRDAAAPATPRVTSGAEVLQPPRTGGR